MVPVRRYARHWRTYIACGGLVLAGLFLSKKQIQKLDFQRKKTHSYYTDTISNQDLVDNVLLSKSLFRSTQEKSVFDDAQHKIYERHFWGKQLRAARRLNWITATGTAGAFFGLIFIGYGLIISEAAAGAAKNAAEETKRQSDLTFAQTRPWIVVNPTVDGPVSIHNSQTLFNIGFELKNVGHSPAFDLQIWYEIRPFFMSPGNENLSSPDFCSIAHQVNNLGFGHWMPPGDEYKIHRVTMFVDNNFIIKASKEDVGNLSRFQALVIGCAVYRINGDINLHQTPFVYKLNRWTAEHPTGVTLFRYEVGAEFTTDSLRLQEEEQAKGPEPD